MMGMGIRGLSDGKMGEERCALNVALWVNVDVYFIVIKIHQETTRSSENRKGDVQEAEAQKKQIIMLFVSSSRLP